MVRALGYSNAPFKPFRAGRLCRGRERWIEPWEPDEGDDEVEVHRLVISGAAFSDLSAADALRGLPHSGVDPAAVIEGLFPGAPLLGFMEDGHPADIPDDALGVELYDGYRAGGRGEVALVRWCKRAQGVEAVQALLGQPGEDRLRGFAVLDADASPDQDEALFDALFPLVGMATLDSPPARFQPAALPELLHRVRALILVHRDKHGLSLGVYTAAPLAGSEVLRQLVTQADCLLVPFAIPPMLARWDRALAELRDHWEGDAPFPVPEPDGGYQWDRRRRRRPRRGAEDEASAAEEDDEELPVAADVDDDPPETEDDSAVEDDDDDAGDDDDDSDDEPLDLDNLDDLLSD